MSQENADLEALGRRAGAWWMPGMATTDGRRFASRPAPKMLSDGTLAPAAWVADSYCKLRLALVAGLIPDFADPATLGCLEEVAARAWNAEIMVLKEVIRSGPHAGRVSHRVAVFRPEKSVDWGWTERYLFETTPERALRPMSRAEALIAAIDAAPAEPDGPEAQP